MLVAFRRLLSTLLYRRTGIFTFWAGARHRGFSALPGGPGFLSHISRLGGLVWALILTGSSSYRDIPQPLLATCALMHATPGTNLQVRSVHAPGTDRPRRIPDASRRRRRSRGGLDGLTVKLPSGGPSGLCREMKQPHPVSLPGDISRLGNRAWRAPAWTVALGATRPFCCAAPLPAGSRVELLHRLARPKLMERTPLRYT